MIVNILIVALIVNLIIMIGLILMQKSEGGALGMGGGGGGQFMSARGAGNILSKGTQITGTIFFVLSLVITLILANQTGRTSVTDQVDIQALDPSQLGAPQQPQGGAEAPVPAAPFGDPNAPLEAAPPSLVLPDAPSDAE